MKVTTEELERRQVLLTVELDPKKEQDLLQKAAKRIAKEVRIPGFRPGKAPFNVIVRRFGIEAIQQEALEKSADNLIQKALDEADVRPFSKMDLESIEWDPLTLKVKVPIEPKIELADYNNIRLEFEAVDVTDDDVEEALEDLQERNSSRTPVERASRLGDVVTISVKEKDGDDILAERDSLEYELTLPEAEDLEDDELDQEDAEGETGEGVEATEQTSPPFEPDLTTPLLGLSAGDETSFIITYPQDFGNERYAGKDITFEVKLLEVSEKQLSPIDDDFAKIVSDFDTLDELKADIEQSIRRQREAQQNQELGNEVLDRILEDAEIEWPLVFEEETIEAEISNYERQINRYGLSLDNYLQMENKTRDDFVEEQRSQIVERLKRNLMIGELAHRQKLQVNESEILERAKLMADMSGRGDQFWRQIISSQVQQSLIANDLLVEKVINFLAAIAKGEDPTAELASAEGEVEAGVRPVESETETTLVTEDEEADDTPAPIPDTSPSISDDKDAGETAEPTPAEAKS